MNEGTCVGVIVLAVLWGVVSAASFADNVVKEEKEWAWFWAVSFAASSLAITYCFSRLLWGREGMAAVWASATGSSGVG